MKPSLNGYGNGYKTKQGQYKPRNIKKYIGDPSQVFYRSNWERQVCKWCDKTPSVLMWGSEEVCVPYISLVDGRQHNYFVDFVIKLKGISGEEITFLIEVKPERQAKMPTIDTSMCINNKSKLIKVREMIEYSRNASKWDAAIRFAHIHGMKFEIWSEKTLRRMGILQ